ncbi:MAG: SGNH/GDSL hydrolase family protein [Elusimicrobiota bacterium]
MSGIYCFGDSITRGENDLLHGGWADRLKAFYLRQYCRDGDEERCVYNLGIGGETTAGLRRRFLPELQARLDPDGRSVASFAYGANDAAGTGKSFVVPIAEYIKNLSYCIDAAKKMGCEVFLLNITPVSDVVDGARKPNGRLRKNLFIRRYNEALRGLALENDAVLVDVHSDFVTYKRTALFAPDGVHPNAAGHALIYRAVKKQLEIRKVLKSS